jgi:ELWxxDGT repeat protein
MRRRIRDRRLHGLDSLISQVTQALLVTSLSLESLEPRTMLSGLPTLIDIAIGAGAPSPILFTNVNYMVFFANEVVTGRELWKSDGTVQGTKFVKHIHLAGGHPDTLALAHVNEPLFFKANNGTKGVELGRSTDFGAGTVQASDIHPGAGSSSPGLFASSFTRPLFNANDGTNGNELWALSNPVGGGAGSPAPLGAPSSSGSLAVQPLPNPLQRRVGNEEGAALSVAADETASAIPMSPASSQSMIPLPKIVSPTSSSLPLESNPKSSSSQRASNHSSSLPLVGRAGEGGGVALSNAAPGNPQKSGGLASTRALLVWEQLGPELICVLLPSRFTVQPVRTPFATSPLMRTKNLIRRFAIDGSILPRRPVRCACDPPLILESLEVREMMTGLPTLIDVVAGAGASNADNFTNVNNTVFFVANDSTLGAELWRSDGTLAGTSLVKDIRPGANGSNPTNLTNVKGIAFLTANDGVSGIELLKSNGTNATTTNLVVDINPGGGNSSPSSITSGSSTALVFAASHGTNWNELWTLQNPDGGGGGAAEFSSQNGGAYLDVQPLPNLAQERRGNEEGGFLRERVAHGSQFATFNPQASRSNSNSWPTLQGSADPKLSTLNLQLSPHNSLPLVGRAGEVGPNANELRSPSISQPSSNRDPSDGQPIWKSFDDDIVYMFLRI